MHLAVAGRTNTTEKWPAYAAAWRSALDELDRAIRSHDEHAEFSARIRCETVAVAWRMAAEQERP